MVRTACPMCARIINVPAGQAGEEVHCSECQQTFRLTEHDVQPGGIATRVPKIERRFPGLHLIALLLYSLAWIGGAAIVLIAQAIAVHDRNWGLGTLGLIYGVSTFLSLFVVSQVIHLLLAIEENSRYTNELTLRREYGVKNQS